MIFCTTPNLWLETGHQHSPLTQSLSTFLWFLTFFLCSFCLSRNSSIPFSSSFSITASWMWEFPTLSISKANQNSYSVSGKVFKDKVTFFRRSFCDVTALWVVTSTAASKNVFVFLHALTSLRAQEQSEFLHGPIYPSCPPSLGLRVRGWVQREGRSSGLHHPWVCFAQAVLLGCPCSWELLPAVASH